MKKFKVKVFLDNEIRRAINAKNCTMEFTEEYDDSATVDSVRSYIKEEADKTFAYTPNAKVLKVEVKEVKSKK